MKLRCTHNSIRLRLRKSDLTTLAETGKVEESVRIGPVKQLSFTLLIDQGVHTLVADMKEGHLSIRLPESTAQSWIASQQVGIEEYLPLEGEERLHLLIEKDFPCQDRVDEDKSDTFWELSGDKPEVC
ncbi:MAG: hypothetical protein AAFR61_29770 [Bacteroidota bacterium]